MKKSILLLHGAVGAKDQLQELATLLSGVFQVHTLNFKGHGGEAIPEQFSITDFSSDVRSYIEQNCTPPVHIFGYSMGGYIGMYLALQTPALIDSVITLATKFHWDPTIAAKEVKMLDADQIEKKLPAFAEQLAIRHAPNDWKDVLAKTKDLLITISENNPLRKEDFAAIQTPSLVIVGDRDKMVCIEETLHVYHALPNAQMAVLPATPHPIEQVSVQQLYLQISHFLSQLP